MLEFAARRPTLLFFAFAILTVAVVLAQVDQVIKETRRSTALEAAISYSNAVTGFRNYYSSVIVPRAKAAGVTVTQSYHDTDTALPLPATVTIELGQTVSRTSDGGSFRLLSNFPFATRADGGPRDDFERAALAALSAGEADQYVEIADTGSLAMLRFAQPVHMKETCVACHNSHPDSPRLDWQVGDVRGIQTVHVPLPNSGLWATLASGEFHPLTQVGLVGSGLVAGLLLIGLLLLGSRNLLRQREGLLQLAESRNQELRIATAAAERANRAKSQFISTMSHELRTPLNAVIGFSEAIESGLHGPVGKPEYEVYARHINASGQQLLAAINDIIDLSKIEAGKFELREHDVDVGRAIAVCLGVVAGHQRANDVTLQKDVPADLPKLRADERALRQIVLKLLSNAVRFSPAGGQVVISARTSATDGFVIEIVDSGIGMKADEIAIAVEAFAQVDGDLNRQFGGLGLGLPLSKKLTELHGGTLDISSEPGAGTTVTVRFPATRIIRDYRAVA